MSELTDGRKDEARATNSTGNLLSALDSHRASSMGANNNNNNDNDYGNNNDDDKLNGRRLANDADDADGQRMSSSAAAAMAGGGGGDQRLLAASASGRQQEEEERAEQRNLTTATRVMVSKRNMAAAAPFECSNSQTQHNHLHTTGRRRRQLEHLQHQRQGKTSLFVSILLPFVLVFLLPTSSPDCPTISRLHVEPEIQLSMFDHLFQSLLRLPLDRLRLSSGYSMMLLASAKEIHHQHQETAGSQLTQQLAIGASRANPGSDLQEEETHMLMMAPEQHAQRQPGGGGGGYQLAPARQPAYGGAAGEHDSSYGQDYAAANANHANLVAHEAAAGAGEDPVTDVMPASASGSVVAPPGGASSAATRTDLPSVRALNVKCEKNHMTVNIVFDRPFYGMVFSKGHYNDQKCVHLPPNSGQTSVNFDIHLGKCGMSSSSDPAAGAQQQALQAANGGQQQQPNGLFIENTVIIQYDPQVQEIYDQARRLRCTWYDYYEKSVTFRPYNVDMLDAVTANFLGDNIQCWMQIQVGKGPWSSEVAGIVKIGQTMTMVLAIKDDENKFDMLVRNCVASDGKHQPIQLVDEYGCVARPKIMAKFQKVRNFGPAATVVSYAHFQAFKFPDSMSVHFQCVIQVCRYECPEPVCSPQAGAGSALAAPAPAGPADPASPASGPQDYAASGTELVSSKELLPASQQQQQRHLNLSHHLLQANNAGHAATPSGSNSVNLKLDESQGRVQVKLDTSMLANSGALAPHLLHSPSQEQAAAGSYATPSGRAGGSSYLSSSYYRPSLGGASAPAAAPPAAGISRATQRPSLAAAAPPVQQYSNPAAASSLLPQHHHQHHPHHHPRPAYMMTNRMGELIAEDGAQHSAAGDDDDGAAKLSLIASPRALPYAMPTAYIHQMRHRRSINNNRNSSAGQQQQPGEIEIGASSKKTRRQLAASQDSGRSDSSTAIKTQRTIQVVSPDDVAFNLLDFADARANWQHDEPIEWGSSSSRQSSRRTKQQQQQQQVLQQYQYQSSDYSAGIVCFSSVGFITSVLVSFGLLATLALVAILVILRQRKRLREKLSPVYDERTPSPDLIINNHQSVMQHHIQQRQQRAASATAEEMILRRQREEIRQRNSYLGRLYSQFVPATYWR